MKLLTGRTGIIHNPDNTMIKKTKLVRMVLVASGAALLYAQPLPAQQPSEQDLQSLRQEVEALREAQKGIQTDLQEIKKLLLARPGASHQAVGTMVSTAGKPFKGDKDARVTLVEFSDYQCPYCSRYVRDTLPQIEKEYVSTGKIKYVFADLALKMHPHAQKAAEAAHCAAEQGKFWEMHDQLFANQKPATLTNWVAHAATIGLDTAIFQQCLEAGKYATQVNDEVAVINKMGITGTPSFVLGLTRPNDPNIKVLKVLIGAKTFASFQEAIDSLLASPPAPGEPAAAGAQPK